ncbi:MAG: urease accessory protein UreD [Planctomycetota bacterium]|nr:MAG: urease accessory protein UreD [Planctomycetota bacterium]
MSTSLPVQSSPVTLAPGEARARIGWVDGASAVLAQQARTPAKLLAPYARGPAVWLCHLTFGGGVVAGDQLDMAVDVEAAASVLLSTQGASKVYKDPQAQGSRQGMTGRIADGALLAHVPHPLTAYAGAHYRQESLYHCQPGGSCCWWECVSAGRPDQGEHWHASHLHLATTLQVGETVLVRDRISLQGDDLRAQLAQWRCMFTLGMYGPRCQEGVQALAQGQAIDGCRISVSPIADGCVVRGLARDVESARAFCCAHSQWLIPQLGDDPWRSLL